MLVRGVPMARKTSDSRISTKRRTWVAARRRTKKKTRWLRDRWFQFFFTTLCRERCSWNFNGFSATTFSSDSSRRIRIGQDHVRLLQIRVAMHAIRIRSGDSFSSGSLYVRGIHLRRKPSLSCFATSQMSVLAICRTCGRFERCPTSNKT